MQIDGPLPSFKARGMWEGFGPYQINIRNPKNYVQSQEGIK